MWFRCLFRADTNQQQPDKAPLCDDFSGNECAGKRKENQPTTAGFTTGSLDRWRDGGMMMEGWNRDWMDRLKETIVMVAPSALLRLIIIAFKIKTTQEKRQVRLERGKSTDPIFLLPLPHQLRLLSFTRTFSASPPNRPPTSPPSLSELPLLHPPVVQYPLGERERGVGGGLDNLLGCF